MEALVPTGGKCFAKSLEISTHKNTHPHTLKITIQQQHDAVANRISGYESA